MPIYDFECHHCNTITEEHTKMDIYHIRCPNPECNNSAERIMSAGHFQLKGNCWGKDGYISKDINPDKPNKK